MYETPYDTELFAELYDVQPQAIVWLRPVYSKQGGIEDFEYSYANQEALNYLRINRDQLAGLKISNSFTMTDELRVRFLQEMREVYTGGKRSETNFYNPRLNRHARVLFSKLRDGVLAILQDLTREKEIIQKLEDNTRQLREQKTLLDNILKNTSNGISVSRALRDADGRVVDALTILANDAAVRYTGIPKENYLTRLASEIDPGLLQSPYFRMCINTLETGAPFVTQYFLESTGRWLELSVSRLDEDHLIHIFTDVTPIKEAQLQVEKAAATMRTVFDAAQTGMFTFAPEYDEKGEIVDFRFVMVNSTISSYAGQPREKMEGALGVTWFPGYLTNGEFDLYKRCFETGEPQRREIHYKLEGHDYYLDLQCAKIDGQLLVTLTDHSTLRKSQLELQQTVRALERSNTQLEDFAHAASHDLKEPLRKIRTFTSRLKSTLAPKMSETELKLFERIEVSAERMQLLVDDLLEFSHVSEQPKELEAVDLDEKVHKVLADLELPIEEKQAQIKMDRLPTVRGNRRQLQQLFQNLIGNALKYSKADVPPEITIQYKTIWGKEAGIELPAGQAEKKFHFFRISDNGIGFEQQYAEQIFKMFQRLHGRSEYSGTGVGLSIARKVVENHNGYIWAEGEPDKGARFMILLPVADQ